MSKEVTVKLIWNGPNVVIEVKGENHRTEWHPYTWERKYGGRYNRLHEDVGGAVCRALGIRDRETARNSQALLEPPETVQLYTYTPIHRPPAYAHCLEGWELIERPQGHYNGFERRTDLPVSKHLFGVIGYRAQLSEEDVKRYELQPLGGRRVEKRLLVF